MSRTCMIKITLFFLLSLLIMCVLVYFFGSFYFAEPVQNVNTQPCIYPTVIIDAGHGGEDGGASSANGLIEKNINLSISTMLRDMLAASGINVIMTREDDRLLYDRNTDYHGRKKKLDHAARLAIIDNTENALFISIHMNSYTDPKYSGLQVWYSQNHTKSLKLADMIQGKNKELLQPENERKIKGAGGSIYLLDKASCPAVLVECGFLSSPEEAARFESEEHRQKVAFMLFCSITEFLNTETE